MKLTITPSGLSAFVLCDDTIAVITGTSWPNGAGGASKEGGVMTKVRFTNQKTKLFRAGYLYMASRYNLDKTWSLTVQRQFNTVEACYAFKNGHPDTVPANGEICETNTSSTGTITRYLPVAFMDSVDCVMLNAVSCDTTYTFSSPYSWQNSP